jgi:F0F1-type ATP synthase membrane subunit b/b'
MDLSIRKDASDVSDKVPSEEDTSESFPNQEEDSETAGLETADPLANLRADFEKADADFESLKADFESQLGSQKADFKSHLDSQKTKADFESQLGSETAALVMADPLANLKADFESLKADFESQLESQKADFNSQLESQKADFKSQLDSETAVLVSGDQLANLKADFDNQKADFKSQLESLQKSGPFSLKRSKSQLEREGKKQLPPDTFSFLVCSEMRSQPFLLGISVFLFQIFIFSLLAIDLIDRDSEDNPLGIPANVETIVRVTQFLAIIISVLTQADLRTSLEQVNEGYSKDRFGTEFGEASRGKWWFAAACRFLEGALGLLVTFFLIVIVDNAFDLLLNFTAMEFVSQLDDVAFFLAGTGYFGSKVKEKSEVIDETTYPQASDEKKRRKILHVLLLGLVFSGMLAGWGCIVKKQKSSRYLCKRFFVYPSQTRSIIESGFYDLMRSPSSFQRDEYIHQNGTEESEPGFRFGYCSRLTAWTFYSDSDEPCFGFTAKSAETASFDIRTTLSSPWVSDNLVQLQPIQLFCVDEVGEFSSFNYIDGRLLITAISHGVLTVCFPNKVILICLTEV